MTIVTLYSDAPVYGGGERYLELLATGFDRREFRADVVLSTAAALDPLSARLASHGVVVSRVPQIVTLADRRAFWRTFKHLAWDRPALIHFNLTDPRACNGAILAAKLAGHRFFVATEHLPHSPFDDGPPPLRHRLAMAWIRRRIALNEAGRAAMVARGLPPESIDVVRNGVVDPGPPSAADRDRARAMLGGHGGHGGLGELGVLPANDGIGDAPLLGFVGRLETQKRPGLFLDVVTRVATALPAARAVFIGDGALRDELEARVRTDPVLKPRVAFLGRRDDVAKLYPGLDLLFLTSSYEGQPLTLLEAGLAEVPVIAARIPGVDEIIVDRETGRLVPPDDPDAYAVAALELLSAPSRRRLAGSLARLRMLTEHAPEAMVRATADVYRRVLGRRAPTV